VTRASAAALAVLAAALLAPGAAQALDIGKAGTPRFPNRTYALTLPSARTLTENQVDVRENGRSVANMSVLAGTAADAKTFGVILAIDASRSMYGRAIRGAMQAARTFASRRNPQQALGVLTFNRESDFLVRLTADADRIEAALLNTPELGGGTRIYDAAGAGIRALHRAGVSGGSVVVLSDGCRVVRGTCQPDDSRLSKDEVVALARETGARIFSVGLRSPYFQAPPLQELAADGGGSYSEAASPEQLSGIYDELGRQLASQYLIRYRSRVGPRKPVEVGVSVDGLGTATASYTTPPLQIPAPPPFERSAGETFWRSDAALVAVSALAACLFAIALVVALRPRSRAKHMQRRLDAFVSSPEERPTSLAAVTDRVLLETEKSLERTSWWPALKHEMQVARLPLAPVQLVAVTLLGTIVAVWLFSLVTGSLLLGLAGLVTPFAVRAMIRMKLKRERFKFADQLADHLQVVASGLRAGHSFVGALTVADESAPQPVRREFERAVADERLGVPVEDALEGITERMDSPDMPHVALVAKLQRLAGANAAEVLDRVVGTIRVRQELRRHIRAITAQQRLARGVLTALPLVLIGVLTLLNRDYIAPLFEEPAGRLMLGLAAVGMILGSFTLKRLVEIDV
jgi:tight adherence protein B